MAEELEYSEWIDMDSHIGIPYQARVGFYPDGGIGYEERWPELKWTGLPDILTDKSAITQVVIDG